MGLTHDMRSSIIPGFDGSTAVERPWESPRTSRLVFALGQESQTCFRPGFDPAQFPEVDVRWLTMDGLTLADWERELRELNPTVLVTGWRSRRVPEDYLPAEECALRYVCHLTGSVREVVPRVLIERGVVVTNWGNAISHTIAEHAMLLVLACLRSMPQWPHYMEQWTRRRVLATRSLRGKRVGVHGFGAIARELIAMLRPFGAEVVAFSHGVPSAMYHEHAVRSCDSLETLFSRSDILVECEALNSCTQGVVDERMLLLLPPGAVFVNVGRGQVVDEDALARVARERGLRVGLDVFRDEPPAMDSPLRTLPGAILSPHIAGPTEDAFALLWDFAMKNISSYLQGLPLQGVVTEEIYDRST
ncbi:phosphoglycerate dehydrogenase [Spartobacteria bacterium LR76]|nr:phosphoglycerate dehydrogenase [Spartobacteria bacterium LR76]